MTTESKAEVRDSWDDVLNEKIHELIHVADWAAIVGYGLIRDKIRLVIAELRHIRDTRNQENNQ